MDADGLSRTGADTPPRTAIRNARVFDGTTLSSPRTVVFERGLVSADTGTAGARVIDARGEVLLPGLIDAHLHVAVRESLHALVAHGVCTALDMGCWPLERLRALRSPAGLATVFSPGIPAVGSRSAHAAISGLPVDAYVDTPEQATAFVAARAAEGADYIKIILQEDGPDPDAVAALVAVAGALGLKTIAHATTPESYAVAVRCRVDVVTHVPLGAALPEAVVAGLRRNGQIVVPTLTMMEGIAAARGLEGGYAAAAQSVRLFSRAGVPVLAGTDANSTPGIPFAPAHGSSLHHELELLVTTVGLSPRAALRAATSLPADHFGLTDRGRLTPGLRADAVLLAQGDPLTDITSTARIGRVWCAGVEYARDDAAHAAAAAAAAAAAHDESDSDSDQAIRRSDVSRGTC